MVVAEAPHARYCLACMSAGLPSFGETTTMASAAACPQGLGLGPRSVQGPMSSVGVRGSGGL